MRHLLKIVRVRHLRPQAVVSDLAARMCWVVVRFICCACVPYVFAFRLNWQFSPTASSEMLVRVALAAAVCVLGAHATEFVTRQGSVLYLNGKPFRWGGANAYWLGLDENVGGIAYPTKFRVTDALETAAAIGNTVIRAHTLGISTGNPLSFEPSLGVFNGSALDSADWAIAEATRLGLHLLIPLTDNYKYYHGGKHNFCDWLGVDEAAFYTDAAVISAFEAYIAARLKHVNVYTGRATIDEPAIVAWETGNELQAPANWTSRIASFIKSVGALPPGVAAGFFKAIHLLCSKYNSIVAVCFVFGGHCELFFERTHNRLLPPC